MSEDEEQRKGRNKATVVNKTYIESGEYRRKFDRIMDSPALNRKLYQLAKQMLYHRSGTRFEDMYWIDADTLEVVAQETERDYEEKIVYSRSTKRIIKQHKNLITIHSHPGSFPPSVDDLISNYRRKYTLGIVACHNGAIYLYSADNEISKIYYNMKVATFRKKGYNELEAQIEMLKLLKSQGDIFFMEVTNDGI